jgi:hypothetical protein
LSSSASKTLEVKQDIFAALLDLNAEYCFMKKISPTDGAVRNGCLVYEHQGQNVVVLVDTPSWYVWLETAITFTFTGEEGTFTAHKARAGNRRGGWFVRVRKVRRKGRVCQRLWRVLVVGTRR